jgi:hypothetical protein
MGRVTCSISEAEVTMTCRAKPPAIWKVGFEIVHAVMLVGIQRRGGVGTVCKSRCEQCGELWCRLVQAGMWKGGAYRMRTTGAASSSSIVSDM